MAAKTSKLGFSLIELLVVIAIVMLLVAMLMPVIMGAREKAMLLYCQSMMGVLGRAHHAYALDYQGGIVPIIRNPANTNAASGCWYNWLKPYGKKELETGTYGDRVKGWVTCPKYVVTYNSYGQNDNIGYRDFSGRMNYWPVKFPQIVAPATTVLMAEQGTLDHNYTIVTGLGVDNGQPYYRFFPTAHSGKLNRNGRWVNGEANVLFCDGHVETVHSKKNWLTMDNLRPPR